MSNRIGRSWMAHLMPLFMVTVAATVPAVIRGQSTGRSGEPDTVTVKAPVYEIDPITVTATRTARPVFETPLPVNVIDQTTMRERQPNNIADLFRHMVGLDVSGMGANQGRPIIRGQRGQRILLLEDGIRLNNSRRQQDFGELPALVDVSGVQRVEVVRGPASVLYGTDAIGGVVNIITEGQRADGVHGSLDYRYGRAQDQHKGTLNLFGQFDRWDFAVISAVRRAESYTAPSGSFGGLVLADETPVEHTGVDDENYSFKLGFRLAPNHRIAGKFEAYNADDAGFGFVDPEAYAPGDATVEILYPFQDFRKYSLSYQASELDFAVADRLDLIAYRQWNQRRLDFDLWAPFGEFGPPGSGVAVHTENFSDLTTLGLRLEAKKLVAEPLLLTYGGDFFTDDSENTDFGVTTVIGFGPPTPREDDTPNVPNAAYRSLGGFVQGELKIGPRGRVVAGGRIQKVYAESRPTDGFTEALGTIDDLTAVGNLNAMYEIATGFSAVATVGRAFRAPNLVELFFEGPTPEGSGYQIRNAELQAETSFNLNFGLRYRTARFAAEGFYFHNTIFNGIRIEPTGEEIDDLAVHRNVNLDELLYKGFEIAVGARLARGFSVGGTHTHITSEDVLDPTNTVGESFSDKTAGWVRYDTLDERLWLQLEGRHNGDQKDVTLGTSPIGDVLPAYTVFNVRGGVDLFTAANGARYRVGVSLKNLTDKLYAEFSNASFFRPEPGRNLTLTLQAAF